MTSLISCEAHDYFEIVCMRSSNIMVTTYSNDVFTGTACNIKLIDKNEVLQVDDGNSIYHIPLTDIKKLEALSNKNSQHNFVVQW